MTQIPGKTQRKSQFDPKKFFSVETATLGAAVAAGAGAATCVLPACAD